MKFLDPTNDLAFKKIFGNIKKKNILISFLNAILDFENERAIIDVEIANPYQIPKIEELKETILDIQATDKAGRTFIVEMQKHDKGDFPKRSLFYSSKAYISQLKKGDEYKNLKKVYFIGIVSFNIFETQNYISRHLILDSVSFKQELKDFEFTFVELQKFNKSLEESYSIADKWLYFLRNAKNLELVPDEFEKIEEFKEAFLIANSFGWNQKELEVYDYMMLKEMDAKNEIETAQKKGFNKGLKEGIEKGFSEGIEKGIKEGIKEGKQEGLEEAKIEIAKNLLDILDNETISIKTGLSISEVEKLRDEKI
jgi:predicted transposase/invertase (TIGR01784 family)